MHERCVLLYGPPGSGKTLVGRAIADNFDFTYLSVGEITRNEMASGSRRGEFIRKCLDEVVEYPSEFIADLVCEHLDKSLSAGIPVVLDGFPKYPNEAGFFLKKVKDCNIKIDAIIVIDVPLYTAIERISKRRMCGSCLRQLTLEKEQVPGTCPTCGGQLIIREDDHNDIVKRRYNDYEQSIKETLALIRTTCDKVEHIDGSQQGVEVKRIVIAYLRENMPG